MPNHLLDWTTPPILCAGIAVVVSRVVYQPRVTVSREWHRTLAREAAIKLIAPRAVAQGSAEATATAGLRSPQMASAPPEIDQLYSNRLNEITN